MGGANERNQGQKGKADDPGRKLTQVARHTSRDTKNNSTTEHTTEPRHKTRGVARTFASTTGPCRTPHTPTSRHQQGGGEILELHGASGTLSKPGDQSPSTEYTYTTPQSATAGRERGTTTTDQTSNVGTIAHKGNNREERGKRRKAQAHPTSHEEHQQHHRAHML